MVLHEAWKTALLFINMTDKWSNITAEREQLHVVLVQQNCVCV